MNRNIKRLYKFENRDGFCVISWVSCVFDVKTSEAMLFRSSEDGTIVSYTDLDCVRGKGPAESFQEIVERRNLVFVKQLCDTSSEGEE